MSFTEVGEIFTEVEETGCLIGGIGIGKNQFHIDGRDETLYVRDIELQGESRNSSHFLISIQNVIKRFNSEWFFHDNIDIIFCPLKIKAIF